MRRLGALGALVRDGWWACSAPQGFFRALAEQCSPRPLRAAAAALLAFALAMAALAAAFVRGTGSDAAPAVWLFALAAGLPYLALVLLLGGLVMVRPAALDLRAWEIAGWAWAPAGALGLSLFPAALLQPGLAVAAGLLAFPVWHMVVVLAGLRALAAGRWTLAAALYGLSVFVLPALLMLIGWAVVSGA